MSSNDNEFRDYVTAKLREAKYLTSRLSAAQEALNLTSSSLRMLEPEAATDEELGSREYLDAKAEIETAKRAFRNLARIVEPYRERLVRLVDEHQAADA